MGDYTELFVEGTLKRDVPDVVVDVLRFLFDASHEERVPPATLPEHPFFNTPRWMYVGTMSSFYHVPMSLSGVSSMHDGALSFVSRSDLKNYNNEIKHFLDWLTPYCDTLRGWQWYEYDPRPEVFNYAG